MITRNQKVAERMAEYIIYFIDLRNTFPGVLGTLDTNTRVVGTPGMMLIRAPDRPE